MEEWPASSLEVVSIYSLTYHKQSFSWQKKRLGFEASESSPLSLGLPVSYPSIKRKAARAV
jgi:hypothetical protein